MIAVRSRFGEAVPEANLLSRTVGDARDAVALGVDIAIIATPAPYHIEAALVFLRGGIPVLVEKPLAVVAREGERLVHDGVATRSAFIRSAVGYVLRHQPAFGAVQAVFEHGRLGALRSARIEAHSYLPEWRPDQDYRCSVSATRELGGGVLRELSHEIDYAAALCGRIDSVIGWRNARTSLAIDVEEQAELMLRHEGGNVTSLSLDFGVHASVLRCMHASFDHGYLDWDVETGRVRVNGRNRLELDRAYPIERDEMFARQLRDFVDAAMTEGRPKCTVDDGLEVLRVIEAAERSFASGAWEQVCDDPRVHFCTRCIQRTSKKERTATWR